MKQYIRLTKREADFATEMGVDLPAFARMLSLDFPSRITTKAEGAVLIGNAPPAQPKQTTLTAAEQRTARALGITDEAFAKAMKEGAR